MPAPSEQDALYVTAKAEPSSPPSLTFSQCREVALVLLGLFVVRSWVLVGALADPTFGVHRYDEQVYHHFAQSLAAGHLLGTGDPFFLSPLWSYTLGLIYRVLGEDAIFPALFAQCGGVLCAGMIWALARRAASHRVALLVAGLSGLTGPLLFYELRLLSDPLVMLTLTAAGLAALRAVERPSALRWSLAGLALGLAITARPSALLLVPLVLGLPAWNRAPVLHRVHWIVLALCTLALPLGVTRTHNSRTGTPALVSASGPINLYIGNGPGANGTYRTPDVFRIESNNPEALASSARDVAERELGRPLTTDEVDRYWVSQTLSHVASDPVTWLQVIGNKAWLLLRGPEVGNNRSYRFERQYLGPLRFSFWLSMGWWIALGLPGLFVLRLPAPQKVIVWSYGVLLPGVTFLAFFVVGRYRLAWMPFLALGAASLVSYVQTLRERHPRALLVPALTLALLTLSLWPPKPSGFVQEHMLRGISLHHMKLLPEAVGHYERAAVSEVLRARALNNMAIAWRDQGRLLEAIATYQRLQEHCVRIGDGACALNARRGVEQLSRAPRPPAPSPSR